MAIIWQTQIPRHDTFDIMPAYDDNYIRFYSDTITNPTKALIYTNAGQFEIYPIAGKFEFNLKEIYTKVLGDIRDELPIQIGVFEDDFILQGKGGVRVVVYAENGDTDADFSTTSYAWLMPLATGRENNSVLNDELVYLTPIQVTIFKGYPFDATIHLPHSPDVTISIGALNISSSYLKRIVFTNGQIPVTNVIVNGKPYKIKHIDKEGIYLKWFTGASWRYFLFEPNEIKEKTKSLGMIKNYGSDRAVSPYKSLGKTAQKLVKLVAKDLEQYEVDNIATLIRSKKVLRYTGTKGQVATLQDWREIEITTKQLTVFKCRKNRYRIEIEYAEPIPNEI